MTTTARDAAIAHDAACRAARSAGEPRPTYEGPSLSGANLSGADLRGADLSGANLSGADLRGANLSEGTVAASAAGAAGGYHWHTLAIADGGCILHYGCNRATLDVWRSRGPEYGARHQHPPEHWATGPAVAIAAAEAMMTTLAAERHGATR
jgi:hypothetical protein